MALGVPITPQVVEGVVVQQAPGVMVVQVGMVMPRDQALRLPRMALVAGEVEVTVAQPRLVVMEPPAGS